MKTWTENDLLSENKELIDWVIEAQDTIRAIRHEEVDAILVSTGDRERVISLQSAEEPNRILLEYTQDGAATLSRTGRILFSNPQMASMLKTPKSELITRSFIDFVSFPNRPAGESFLQAARSNPCRCEIIICAADGATFPASVSLSPLSWHGDGSVGVVVTDISGQKRSEEAHARHMATLAVLEAERKSNERVTAILESMTDCYLAFNREFQFVGLNARAAELLFGRIPSEIIGSQLFGDFPEYPGSEFGSRCKQAIATGESLHFETKMPGTGMWVEAHVYPGADGLEVYLRDITERKSSEIELRQKQEKIESLNARLRGEVTETNHRVKNHLQLMASLIDMRMPVDGNMVSVDELRRIGSHVLALSAIHDILTHEVESPTGTSVIPARAILERSIAVLSEVLGLPTVTSHFDDLDVAPKVATSLAMVLSELLTNCAKHARGEVGVEFTVVEGGAELQVRDCGVGFSDDFDAASLSHNGLQLVEQLVGWDLGGTVGYSNRPGGGACVRVAFPLSGEYLSIPRRN